MNVELQSQTPISYSPTKEAHMVHAVTWNSPIGKIPDGL